jgi:O-succinylbenzoate synthase
MAVRIDEIRVFHVAMPLIDPWKTSFSVMTAVDSVLVRMSGEGEVGWGEAAPYAAPQFCPEWAAGCFQLIRDVFIPRLQGREINSGEELQEWLRPFKGNQFAKGAVDTAWWDLAARLDGVPLWKAIGGESSEVAVGADIPVQPNRAKLLQDVAAALEAGFTRTKLKFRPDSGVDMVADVREALPDAVIHIDCNCGFTLDDVSLFRELDGLGLAMIEQPLAADDLLDHSRLQSELSTPICLDESITSVDRVRKALAIDAGRWINIKHGRVGGLTNALEIHALCLSRGVPCWIGGMLESTVGQGPSLALATLPGISYPADIFPAGRLYAQDLSEPEIRLSGPGKVAIADCPGHGFTPRPDRLAAWLVNAG